LLHYLSPPAMPTARRRTMNAQAALANARTMPQCLLCKASQCSHAFVRGGPLHCDFVPVLGDSLTHPAVTAQNPQHPPFRSEINSP
jgi:hypothetical protein